MSSDEKNSRNSIYTGVFLDSSSLLKKKEEILLLKAARTNSSSPPYTLNRQQLFDDCRHV